MERGLHIWIRRPLCYGDGGDTPRLSLLLYLRSLAVPLVSDPSNLRRFGVRDDVRVPNDWVLDLLDLLGRDAGVDVKL